MFPLFHKKINNQDMYSLKKPFILRPYSNLKRINNYNLTQENKKNISINTNQKEEYFTNYRTSTLSTGTKELSKIKNETLFTTNHTPQSRKRNKNNYLNDLFRNTLFATKIILRPKTALKTRNQTINYTKVNKKINNIYKYNSKSSKVDKVKEFPLSFVQSMRLNLHQNISKANKFLKQENDRLILKRKSKY